MTPEERAAEEARRRAKLKLEQAEFDAAFNALSPEEKAVYELLDSMIEEMGNAGMDTSYCPHSAYMILIKYAKLLSPI